MSKATFLAKMYGTKSSGSISCATVRKVKKRKKKKKRGKSNVGGIVVIDDASLTNKFSEEAVDVSKNKF